MKVIWIILGFLTVSHVDGRSTRQTWRNSVSNSGGSFDSGLDAILKGINLHQKSNQALRKLSTSQQKQLASDLNHLRKALSNGQHDDLRNFIVSAVSKPMKKEDGLEILSRLNAQFRTQQWWRNINMLIVDSVLFKH